MKRTASEDSSNHHHHHCHDDDKNTILPQLVVKEEVPEELGTGSLVYDHSELDGLWEYLDSGGKTSNRTKK